MDFAHIVGMTGNEPRSVARRNQSVAQLERDAALGRVARTRRWMFAGAAALTAGIAGLVSSVAPGRTLSSRSQASAVSKSAPRASVSAAPKMPPLASPSSLGLQGPSQAPQGDSSQAPATQSQAPAAQSQAPAPAPTPQPSGGGVVSGGS
jgi:hypothetical protein